MALFGDFSKKVSGAGQSAITKAKELADITKLNSMINDEEKTINSYYYQIGKLYVSLHRSDSEENFVSMIRAVSESEAKIQDYKKQIQDVKGIKNCPNCGAEVPNGAAFCSSCGTPMPQIPVQIPADSIKCPGCGALVKKGNRFCTSCGNKMDAPVMNEAAPVPQVEFIEEPATVVHSCPNCGAVMDPDMAFCTECGTKL